MTAIVIIAITVMTVLAIVSIVMKSAIVNSDMTTDAHIATIVMTTINNQPPLFATQTGVYLSAKKQAEI